MQAKHCLVVAALACLPPYLPALAQDAPRFSVDASWPLALPDRYILGQVSGLTVDSNDHVWIVHRPKSLAPSELGMMFNPPLAECCTPAPAVIEFDATGAFVQGWGGPVWDRASQGWQQPASGWPANEHGIHVDADGFVWLGGNGETDHSVHKYSRSGEWLLSIGITGETGGSNDTQRLGRPADMAVDTIAREIYVADGYLNRRVVVFDSVTGVWKRHWGAYGNRPDDAELPPYDPAAAPLQQFRGPVHSVELSRDGLVYVADRGNDRIQVFTRAGEFVTEARIAPATLGNGSAWDLALSPDAEQRWLYLADGQNMKVWVLERATLDVVGEFGRGGRQAGQFDWVHNMATDSQGNVYTAEVNNGRRIQKFTPVNAD